MGALQKRFRRVELTEGLYPVGMRNLENVPECCGGETGVDNGPGAHNASLVHAPNR